ncbi:unnamed protein product [Prorocentrum cordatum]|uniref:Uncharacterized protein n=1 Tax=Prorocentrum cordatum TaxID=2364126 RepID=A0ABN9TW56_9DINO|nr:unnamed protein product [Polarella glacialis]
MDDILVYVSAHEIPLFRSSAKCIKQMVGEEHRRRTADLQESDEHARDRKMQHGPLAKGGAGCSKEGEDKNKTLVVFGWRKWWGTNTNRLQSVLRGLVLKDVFSKVVFLNQVEGDNFSDIMRNLEVVKFNTTSGKDGAKVKVELRRCTMIERGKNGEKKKVGVVKVYKNGESAGQVHFDSEDNHCVQLKLDGGKTQFFESQHDDDPRDSRDFEAHSQLVKDISNVLIENHLNCGSADLDWVSVRLKAMLLPNKAPPGQPQHPHFLCGDDKVTWEHVGGDPANVQDVEKLLKNLKDPYTDERRKPDVVVILSTQGLPEADEIPQSCQEKRMLVIMLQLRHLLNKIWQKEGNGVHVVVENSLDQTAELALGPPGGDDKDNPGVAADFLNSQAIQARALVQALANPDIHSCVSELWDEQYLPRWIFDVRRDAGEPMPSYSSRDDEAYLDEKIELEGPEDAAEKAGELNYKLRVFVKTGLEEIPGEDDDEVGDGYGYCGEPGASYDTQPGEDTEDLEEPFYSAQEIEEAETAVAAEQSELELAPRQVTAPIWATWEQGEEWMLMIVKQSASKGFGILDIGATSNIVGIEAVKKLRGIIYEQTGDNTKMDVNQKSTCIFGDGSSRTCSGRATFPLEIAGVDGELEINMLDADAPLWLLRYWRGKVIASSRSIANSQMPLQPLHMTPRSLPMRPLPEQPRRA